MRHRVIFTIVLAAILMPLLAVDMIDLEREHQRILEQKRQLSTRIEQSIRQYPQSPDLPYLYYKLARLSAEIEGIQNPRRTAQLYEMVIDLDPTFNDRDVVLYNMAFFYYDAARQQRASARERALQNDPAVAVNWPDEMRLTPETPEVAKAIDAYNTIFAEMTQSIYSSEAVFRLGNLYYDLAFDSRDPERLLDVAQRYFNILANREDDPLQKYGQFNRGWVNFTAGNYDAAIEDFAAILNTFDQGEAEDLRVYFQRDAIENIAFSLVQTDSLDFEGQSQAAQLAREGFIQLSSVEMVKQVLTEAINLKIELNAPMQAVDLYQAYIFLYPADILGPSYIDSIITIYKRYPARIRGVGSITADNAGQMVQPYVIDAYELMVNTYGPDSQWFSANSDTVGIGEQLDILRHAYIYLGQVFWNRFSDTRGEEEFEKFVELYTNFSKYSPFMDEDGRQWLYENEARAIQGSLTLADEIGDPTRWLIAWRNIVRSNDNFPDNANFMVNETNAYFAVEKIFTLLDSTIDQQAYVDTLHDINIDRAYLNSMYIDGSLRYEHVLRNDSLNVVENGFEQLVQIIFKRAELRFETSLFDEAYTDFEDILALAPEDPDVRKVVLDRLAFLNNQRGNFTQAEDFYRRSLEYTQDDEERVTIENNIASAIQSGGNAFKESGNYAEAAQEFLRLADQVKPTDTDAALAFMAQAVDMYNQIPDYLASIGLLRDMADMRELKEEVLSYFVSAWNTADSLMGDQDLGDELRWEFVNERFPGSNEAYNIEIGIIQRFAESEDTALKEQAATMYVSVHDRADEIDMGEDTRENLYLNAISLHQDMGNEDTVIEMMLAFEIMYPEHEMANDFLVTVARIYKDRGNEARFKEMAFYINEKDPSIPLLESIAADELKEHYNAAIESFKNENYEVMREAITAYNATQVEYARLNLENAAAEEQFIYFEQYITYHQVTYVAGIAAAEAYLSTDPNELLLVGKPSKWKTRIAPRVEAMPGKAEVAATAILETMRGGNEFDITIPQQTRLLWLAGQAYEYSHDVVVQQVQKYIDVTDESDKYRQSGPVVFEQFQAGVAQATQPQRTELLRSALSYYNTMLENFADNTDYTDEYTEQAIEKLIEFGFRKPKETTTIAFDSSWRVNSAAVTDYDSERTVSQNWTGVNIVGQVSPEGMDEMQLAAGNMGMDSFYRVRFNAEIVPELIRVNYLAAQSAGVYINGQLIERESSVVDSVEVDGYMYILYSMAISDNLFQGNNDLAVSPVGETQVFSAQLVVQYDQEQIDFFRNTELATLGSDLDWYTLRTDSLDTGTVEIGADWQTAASGHFSFYKVQMQNMQETNALEIWSPTYDSTAIDTVWFIKQIDVPTEIVKADLKFIGQQYISVWINGEPLFTDLEIIVDNIASQVLPYEISLEADRFQSGTNTILIKVVGAEQFKGMIFDMQYYRRK
ncbi:MAG: hypothetical protein K8R90_04730 [Candidatus Cloacimonetes bacterium]|nr:hypothetical protein [Candidatus Cloacimonadota bacterium]